MKECERICGLFGDFHDGRVDGSIGKHITEHLDNCPGCKEEYMWYGFTIKALADLERVSPPPDFLAQLHQRIHETSSFSVFNFLRNLFNSAPHIPLPVGVSALVLVFVLGIAVYNNAPPMPTAQPAIGANFAETRGTVEKARAVSNFPSGALYAESYSFPTIADTIGADNLTVESPSVEQAIDSLKRMLPGIQGKLVNETIHQNMGEKIIAVMIPSDAYAYLTTELINHGAVAAGASSDSSPPPLARKDGNVLLYIRFVNSR